MDTTSVTLPRDGTGRRRPDLEGQKEDRCLFWEKKITSLLDWGPHPSVVSTDGGGHQTPPTSGQSFRISSFRKPRGRSQEKLRDLVWKVRYSDADSELLRWSKRHL